MPKRVYWDTCCFLGWFQQEADKRDALRVMLDDAEAGELILITSSFTITECAGLPTVRKVDNAASRKMLAFFEQEYIVLRAVERNIAEKAHDYVREHAIKHKDAVHLATAVDAGVEVMFTYDAAKGGQAGLLTHNRAPWLGGLRIERPPNPVTGTVFDPKNLSNG